MTAPRYTINCAHCGVIVRDEPQTQDYTHAGLVSVSAMFSPHLCQDANNATKTYESQPDGTTTPHDPRDLGIGILHDLRHYPPPTLWQTISANWPYVAGGAVLLVFAAACALALWWFLVAILTLS